MVVKWPNSKVVSFILNRSICLENWIHVAKRQKANQRSKVSYFCQVGRGTYLCSVRSKQGHYMQKYCGVIKSCFSTQNHCQKSVNLSIFKDSTSTINQFICKMVFLHQVTLKVSKFQKQIFSFRPKTEQNYFLISSLRI